MKKIICLLLCLLLFTAGGCSSDNAAVTKEADLSKLSDGPQYVIKEKPADWESTKLESIEQLTAQNSENIGLDLRFTDLSALDLRKTDLTNATFDSKTIWPNSMPDTFDIEKAFAYGKDPGLGIRELHEKGITGKGVNVAIIDQALLLDHQEYKGKIMLYEQLHTYDTAASMHGPAVTSILAGNSVGVAPDVKIYYINTTLMDYHADTKKTTLNLAYMAQAIERILEVNASLPANQKIRVISISRGFSKDENPDVYQAVEKAKQAGIFVVTTSTAQNYDIEVFGAGRSYDSDPGKSTSYKLPNFLNEKRNKAMFETTKVLFAPMDNRTIAGPLSNHDYAHYALGGFSWSTPWVAGMYALCLQVDPDLTGDQFLEAAYDTGDKMKLSQIDVEAEAGRSIIINPKKLIEKVEKAAE